MKYNDNGTYKDIYVKAFDTLPVGAIVEYSGSTIPDGWTDIGNNQIQKTSQYIEGGASLSNVYGTSNENGYTQEYINELETYSTTEQRIGTWIGNKPLYRKVFYLTSNLSSPIDIVHGISNIEYIKVEGQLTTSTTSTPPFYNNSTDFFRVFRNNIYLSARYGSGITATSITFIVEYTKTTD